MRTLILNYSGGDYAKIYNYKGQTRSKLYNKEHKELERITDTKGKTIGFKVKQAV